MLGTASGIWRQNLKRETGESWGRDAICPWFWMGCVLGWKVSIVGAGCASSAPKCGQGKRGLRSTLSKREGGEVTDLAAGFPRALPLAARP